jgi:hypothetical protein
MSFPATIATSTNEAAMTSRGLSAPRHVRLIRGNHRFEAAAWRVTVCDVESAHAMAHLRVGEACRRAYQLSPCHACHRSRSNLTECMVPE